MLRIKLQGKRCTISRISKCHRRILRRTPRKKILSKNTRAPASRSAIKLRERSLHKRILAVHYQILPPRQRGAKRRIHSQHRIPIFKTKPQPPLTRIISIAATSPIHISPRGLAVRIAAHPLSTSRPLRSLSISIPHFIFHRTREGIFSRGHIKKHHPTTQLSWS